MLQAPCEFSEEEEETVLTLDGQTLGVQHMHKNPSPQALMERISVPARVPHMQQSRMAPCAPWVTVSLGVADTSNSCPLVCYLAQRSGFQTRDHQC